MALIYFPIWRYSTKHIGDGYDNTYNLNTYFGLSIDWRCYIDSYYISGVDIRKDYDESQLNAFLKDLYRGMIPEG